ncbi:MAG: hypothetical protein VXW38_12045 [Bacteroidota bacterium]|nr:hypothetical protein [Bacteroidota bacterium]
MKKHLSILVVFGFLGLMAQGQYVIKDNEELQNLKNLPEEKVFVHHTGPVVFVGEYVHYAFYCFNAQTNKASNISYVGYVALVNEKGEYVHEEKIRLEKGLAQGDFFLNTEIPSGHYKLLGYTQWMKNNGLPQVFKDDIVIINPYQVDQQGLMGEQSESMATVQDIVKVSDSSIIQIRFDKEQFNTREKVKLVLRNYKGPLGYGNFTVRIQKKSPFPIAQSMNAMEYGTGYLNVANQIDKQVGDSLFLPEQRGELLFGKVTNQGSGEPVDNTKMVISIPGEEFLLQFATTDPEGNFYTYLRKDYKVPQAVIQAKDLRQPINVELLQTERLDLTGMEFGQFALKPEYAEIIKKRSIYNQIENQFFAAKPDSVLLGLPIDPFDGGIPEIIDLDEYTRFPTLQETLVELLKFAGYRNGKDGDYIRIAQDLQTYNEKTNDFPAIVLIDGVFIPHHETIKEFDARKIKTISLIRDQFALADRDYQGMMVIKTIEGDFYETYAPEHGINVPIEKPRPKKNYYQQRYDMADAVSQNIPDYRSLLFWKPHVELESDALEFEFYTSDLTGDFDVILDGFTTYGKPITVYKSISVRNESQ